MPNIIPDPSFEQGTYSDWTYTGLGDRYEAGPNTPDTVNNDGAVNGSFVGRVRVETDGAATLGTIQSADVPIALGHTYTLAFQYAPMQSYLESLGLGHGCALEYDLGDGTWGGSYTIAAYYDYPAYTQTGPIVFVALGSTFRLRIRTTASDPNTVSSSEWWFDDFSLTRSESTMAVRLAERSVDAIVALLQSEISDELGAINADRGDGITLAVPAAANYYAYPNPEVAGATVHVEVFEAPTMEFTHPYTDAAAERAVYDLPVSVRVTFYNRQNYTRHQMRDIMRRYACALKIVLLKNYELADSDDATVIARLDRIETDEAVDPGTDNVSVIRVQATVTVQCEECVA